MAQRDAEDAEAVVAELAARCALTLETVEPTTSELTRARAEAAGPFLAPMFEEAQQAMRPIVQRGALLLQLGVSTFGSPELAAILNAAQALSLDTSDAGKSSPLARQAAESHELGRRLSAAMSELAPIARAARQASRG